MLHVEKTHLIRQLNVEDFTADVLLDNLTERASQVAPQNEDDAEAQAHEYPDQEIGQQDRGDGDDDRLFPAFQRRP
mgnify:CR=1 FL=1